MLKKQELQNSNYNLVFISRHELTNGQKALVKKMGFETSERVSHNFRDTSKPMKEFNELVGNKINQIVGLVGPTHLFINILTQAGFQGPQLIEFVNVPSARERGKFLCKGAYMYCYYDGRIETRFIECPLNLEEQDEGDLNYDKA